MKNFPIWLSVANTVAIAVLANSISTTWGKSENKFSFWLVALLIVSPMVFLSFGLLTSKLGLTISSGVVDSLLTFSTVSIGLIVFNEWSKISLIQYVGMAMALTGMILMLFFHKETGNVV